MTALPFEFAQPDFPLADATLYRVGGPARLALLPRTIEEASIAYDWLSRQGGRRFMLGAGSNVLISDKGIDGTVLVTTRLRRIEAVADDRYRVECGVFLDRLVREVMLPNNYAGVGGLAGIPGTVGGAIFMNAGTVNGTTCQLLESVDVLAKDAIGEGSTADEGLRRVSVLPSMYSYRGQTFCPKGGLILGGIFRFERARADQCAVYEHYIQRRKNKQPQGHCCGSVFRNPEGDHAGRLIEACGLKGTRLGGAIISPMHANFIMNENGATFADVKGLIDLCKRRVAEQFRIELREEVVIIDE